MTQRWTGRKRGGGGSRRRWKGAKGSPSQARTARPPPRTNQARRALSSLVLVANTTRGCCFAHNLPRHRPERPSLASGANSPTAQASRARWTPNAPHPSPHAPVVPVKYCDLLLAHSGAAIAEAWRPVERIRRASAVQCQGAGLWPRRWAQGTHSCRVSRSNGTSSPSLSLSRL